MDTPDTADIPAKPYHHGDLRRALLESYLSLLQQGRGWQLTLRELARQAGVSHTAAYKHFPDKANLLAAVATLGFERLREHMLDACAPATLSQREGFLAVCHAYMRFGIAQPGLYRLMFSAEARECADPLLKEKGLDSLGVLVDAVAQGQRSGWLRERDAFLQAHSVWAQLHGLTVLTLDGLVGPAGGSEAAATAGLCVLLEGLESGAQRSPQ